MNTGREAVPTRSPTHSANMDPGCTASHCVSRDDGPILVTAEYILGPGETHFSRHHFRIRTFVLETARAPGASRRYILQSEFITARQYPSLDEVSKIDVLSHEKVNALAPLWAGSGDPAAIAAIDAVLATTERNASRYRRTEHSADVYAAESGSLVGLHDGPGLRKLSAYLQGHNGKLTQHVYFSSGAPVFLDSTYEESETESSVQHRVYLGAGRPIRRMYSESGPGASDGIRAWDPLPELLGRLKEFAACAASSATSCSKGNGGADASKVERYDGYPAGMPLPRRFDSRAAITAAGCRFGHVKGPEVETCVLGAYGDNALNLYIYERLRNDSYTVTNELTIPSQYHDSTLTLVDMLGQRTDWLVVETTGMHGTGIAQRVLFVLAWDGSRFRAVAAESLDYRCSRPTAPADYTLKVQHVFRKLGGAPGLVLDYQLTKDGQLIGKWTHQLRWSAYELRFIPNQSKVEVRQDPVIHHLLGQLERVRVYSASGPMDPANNAARWMQRSELVDVLAPACSPSLLYLTRAFHGKWMLDRQRTPATPLDAWPLATTLWTDREGLHVTRRGKRADGTYFPIEDLYRLEGKEFPIEVRTSTGEAVTGAATAALDGEKMVVTIRVKGWSQPLRRVIYVDGMHLVFEDSGGAAETNSVMHYVKM